MKTLYTKSKFHIQQAIKRGVRVEAHIADIHFGSIDPKVQYDILNEQFLQKIYKLKLDLVSINGDLFDHKFMSNSDVVMYAMEFVDNLVRYCRSTGCTLILLHGTMSHDANQLKLFYRYLNDPSVDIRIIEEARFEDVKDKKILCIPEMYNRGAEYYNTLLYDNGYFDGCVLHGTIVGSIYGKEQEDLNSDREPVFSIRNFLMCKGPIVCGHVHVAQCLKNDIYYTGSPIRDRFGEEQPKGFSILLHDLDTREYYMHFEEIKSFRYDTVNLDDMLSQDPKKIIEYISKLKDDGIDHIRVIFTMPSSNIPIVKNYFRTNPNVVIKDDLQSRQLAARNEIIKEKFEKYSYILDKNLSPYEILVRYINQNMNEAYITTDELMELLKE